MFKETYCQVTSDYQTCYRECCCRSEDYHWTVGYTVIGSAFQGWSIHECSMQDKYGHTLTRTPPPPPRVDKIYL